MPPRSPAIIGHRGASGYRPEHTAAAFELAFELGADFVEPDLVVTRDGVLVIRHENEISGTTDVAGHPEFAGRRTTKLVDGTSLTGWFTEDFTWAELQTLRCVERLPRLRPENARFDGQFGLLRLADLFELVDRAQDARQRPLGVVAELKHAASFASLGLPLADLFAASVEAAGWGGGDGRLVVESFEPTVLRELHDRGLRASSVLLVEADGVPADLVASLGRHAPSYAEFVSEPGLTALAADPAIDGISVPKSMLLHDAAQAHVATGATPAAAPDAAPRGAALVSAAHDRNLSVYTWTLRPENAFLEAAFRGPGGEAEWGDWSREFGRILACGVDGVFADHPDLAVDVRGRRAD